VPVRSEEAAAEEASAPETLPHPAMERIIRPVSAIANTFFIFILKNLLLHKKSVFCFLFFKHRYHIPALTFHLSRKG
jgi:hypothetical protein